MIAECFAVVIIVLALAFLYVRARKAGYALAVVPLAFVPLMHLLMGPLDNPLAGILGLGAAELTLLADIAAALAAFLCFGIFSARFSDPANRKAYLIACSAFTLIFTAVLVRDLGIFGPV